MQYKILQLKFYEDLKIKILLKIRELLVLTLAGTVFTIEQALTYLCDRFLHRKR